MASALVASGMLGPAGVAHSSTSSTTRPNVVFIITDDQRWDQLSHMPNVKRLLVHAGTRFTNAYVTDGLCCPSRISMLRGQYDHTTGVYNNAGVYGGWQRVHSLGLENSTLATWLHGAGYRTGFVGKYFNGYNNLSYVPPGWDVWRARKGPDYYNYDVSENGVPRLYGSTPADYDADVMTSYADAFIRGTPTAQPLFLWVAYHEPHAPYTPAPRYVGDHRCATETNTDAPSFNEADVSDKPAYISAVPSFSPSEAQSIGTTNWVDACESLLAVDSGVSTVVSALADTGRLANTLIVYVSDSGLLYGEHRVASSKAVPYEESMRIPMIMRYDPLTNGVASTDSHLALGIDLAPTIADLTGLSVTPGCPSAPWKGVCHPGFDGRTLLPLVGGRSAPFARSAFLIEHYENPTDNKIPTYCATHTRRYLYVRYGTGEQEMYDLQTDPYELTNMLFHNNDPSVETLRAQLLARLKSLCTPTPPDYSFSG
jgi:N-acetylglucosamine-6-sulfatase